MFDYKQILTALCLLSSVPLLHAEQSIGQQLALDSNKGNCHACHNLSGSENSGNIGPPIQNIAQKYLDIKQLQSFLNDPALTYPNTIMPPYGRHQILTKDEIIAISKFIHSL